MTQPPDEKIIDLLLESFGAVVNVARPMNCLPPHIPSPPEGNLYVIGAGKAAAEMARVFELHYKGKIKKGLVVTRYGFEVPTKHIKVMQAAHPVSDENGVVAVKAIMKILSKVKEDDLVVCLLSGGGSALLTAPVDGVPFSDVQEVGRQLVHSGASITEINMVRKHLNVALGGGLVNSLKAGRMLTLAISDVEHNNPSVIASGPTIGDETSLTQCLSVLYKYKIKLSDAVNSALKNPKNETPNPADLIFKKHEYKLIATPDQGMVAAQNFWESQGFDVKMLGAHLGGDTNDLAMRQVYTVRKNILTQKLIAIISGGETTVHVTGRGAGGPNTQFMLASAIALNGLPSVFGLSCDTDGIDGSEDAAGALITPSTLHRAQQEGVDARVFLEQNNSYNFFQPVNNLILTGPTQTNINDYRVFLIFPR